MRLKSKMRSRQSDHQTNLIRNSFLILVVLSQICKGYKILVVFPFPGRSHGILGEGYVRNLLEAGHEVTYITPFPLKNSDPKLHQVDVSENKEAFKTDMWNFKQIVDRENVIDFRKVLPHMRTFIRTSIEHEKVQELLKNPEQTFDLVILQWIMNEVYAGFATAFDCPYIWSSSLEPHWAVLRLIHEPSNPAFNADVFSTVVPPFNFVQRVKSLFTQIFVKGLLEYYVQQDKAVYEEVFGSIVAKKGRELPPYEEVLYNASLIFSNSHVALGQPISQPPNSIEIGGYHIDTNIKPLPRDLQKIMDGAKYGVIYFSMGTNIQTKNFPDELKRDILNVFGGLKQAVIWKFDGDLLEKPNNVHIVKWAPQTSILAHPNCRLFITHGGLLSTTETVYFGVPTIVLPTAADQYVNAERAVKKGFALKVEVSYQMAPKLKTAIEEVLNNPKYTERIKDLSMIYHDRLVPPGKELVHWVEHVARTRGAPHLRSPALMLPWYQKMYLDLAALVLVVLFLIKYAFGKIKNLFAKKAFSQKKIN